MTTMAIKYRDFPTYLHAGDFYRNLGSDDPEGIVHIPVDSTRTCHERQERVITFSLNE